MSDKTSLQGGAEGKARNVLGDGRYRWIRRWKRAEMLDRYLVAYMTRLYFTDRLEWLIAFFSKGRTMREIEAALARRSPSDRSVAYEFIAAALERRFLVPISFSEQKKMGEIRRRMMSDDVNIELAYFIFSLNCNLKCPHCFMLKDMPRSGFPVMTKKEIERYGDYFLFNMGKTPGDPQIFFYGGEPLLYPDLLEHCVLHMERRAAEKAIEGVFSYTAITNGTLLPDRILKFAQDYRISLGFSLDGFAPQHDRQRFEFDGSGTFKLAIANVERAFKAGLEIGFSVTATPANVGTLPKFVDWLHKRFDGATISFNWLMGNATRHTKLNLRYFKQLEYLYLHCSANGILEGKTIRRLKDFDKLLPHRRYCAGYGGQVVFLPGDMIGPCQAFSNTCYAGDRKNFIRLPSGKALRDSKLWKRWRHLKGYEIPHCFNDCDMTTLCGGGCAYHTYVQCGNICHHDEIFCRIMEVFFKIYTLGEFNNIRSVRGAKREVL